MEPSRERHAGSKTLITLAAIVIVVAGLKLAGTLFLPFLVAIFLSVLCTPGVLWMERRGLQAGAAVAIVMIVALTILAVFGALISTTFGAFAAALPGYQAALGDLVTSARFY